MNEFDARPGSTIGSTLRARAVAIATEMAQNSARDIAYVVFRRKGIILSSFTVVVLATFAYLFVTPYSFMSTTQIIIRQGRENIAMDTAMVEGRSVMQAQNLDNAVSTSMSILKSPILAEQVAEALSQNPLPEAVVEDEDTFTAQLKSLIRYGMGLPTQLLAAIKPDKLEHAPMTASQIAARKVISGMAVEVEKRTNILNLSFTADSPERAQKTLEKIVDLFIVRYIEVNAPKTSTQFFEERLKTLEMGLIEKQQKRDEYLSKYGIATAESQKTTILEQITNAEVSLSNTTSEIGASEAKIAALEKALNSRPQTIVTSETEGLENPMAEKLKSDLADLRLQEMDMAARYADSYRPLSELRDQIKQVEGMLAAEQASSKTVTTAPDPGYQSITLALDMERASIESLRAREKSLAADVEVWRQKLADLTGQESALSTLTRELDIAKKEFDSYQEGFQRAKTSRDLDMENISNVSVVQPATYSPAPAAPNSLRILALGLFVALFGSIFFAFSLEYIDNKVYTKEDIEKHVPLPVLTVITDQEFRGLPVLARANGVPAEQQVGDPNSRELMPLGFAMPQTAKTVTEKMFSLNRRISVLMEYSTAGLALIFTDVQAPRESSKLAFEYAQLLAGQGRHVLLLALGSTNHPLLQKNLPTDKQWQNVMNDGLVTDGLIRLLDNSSLAFTQIGHTKDSLQSLASSPQFDALIYKIRSQFDVVLVDCPPLSEYSIAPRLSQITDGTIMVVDAGKTRWQVIHNYMREFQINQGKVIGVILNKRKFYVPEIIYRWL